MHCIFGVGDTLLWGSVPIALALVLLMSTVKRRSGFRHIKYIPLEQGPHTLKGLTKFIANSAVLPINHVIKRDSVRPSVRPSVCPSVCHTPIFCRNGWTYHQTFSPSASHTILVFPHQTLWQYSDRNIPNGGHRMQGVYEKIAIFDQYLALSRK